MKIGMPKSISGETKATAGEITTITFKKPVYSIIVENESTSYNLFVSFDMGECWIKIRPEKYLSVEPFATKGKPVVLLKSDGASQPYQIIYRFVEGE